MRWRVERAVLASGRSTRLIVDDEDYEPHPEALEFVFALQAADRSPNTLKAYLGPIARFLTWCAGEGVDWRTVNLLHVTRFKHAVQDTPTRTGLPPNDSSVSLALTAVCEFLRYCAAAGHIDPAVAQRLVEQKWIRSGGRAGAGENGQFRRVRVNALRVNTTEQRPEILSDNQVSAMREAASTARDRFLLRLLHEGGPRIGEGLGMRLEDVHLLPDSSSLGCGLRGAHFHVVRRADNDNGALAKSLRSRNVPVVEAFVTDYRDYRYERSTRIAEDTSAYVFVNYEGPDAGRPMTYSNVYKLIHRLGRRCGFPATPHMFRHTAATAWVEGGAEADVVQELLGHASPKSTAIYLHPAQQRMREAVRRVHTARSVDP
ncbi:tyrosine-type recombinase/integrase [Citricoccus nitrophenolicus]